MNVWFIDNMFAPYLDLPELPPWHPSSLYAKTSSKTLLGGHLGWETLGGAFV